MSNRLWIVSEFVTRQWSPFREPSPAWGKHSQIWAKLKYQRMTQTFQNLTFLRLTQTWRPHQIAQGHRLSVAPSPHNTLSQQQVRPIVAYRSIEIALFLKRDTDGIIFSRAWLSTLAILFIFNEIALVLKRDTDEIICFPAWLQPHVIFFRIIEVPSFLKRGMHGVICS